MAVPAFRSRSNSGGSPYSCVCKVVLSTFSIGHYIEGVSFWQPLDVVLPLADLTSNAQSIPRIPFHAQFLADDAIHFPWYGFE